MNTQTPNPAEQRSAAIDQAAQAFGSAAAAVQQAMGHSAPPPGPRVRQIGIAPWLVPGEDIGPNDHSRETREERHYRIGFTDGWKQGAFDIFVMGLVVGGGVGVLLVWAISRGGAL